MSSVGSPGTPGPASLTPEQQKQYEEYTNICASAFIALLEANGIPKPGDEQFEAHKEEVYCFSFIFSKGFEVGLHVGQDHSCKCEEKSSIILP